MKRLNHKCRLSACPILNSYCCLFADSEFDIVNNIQSTPSLSKSKGPVFFFEITEFCYKGSNICAIQALGEKTHFDISDHFVITEFD